VASSPKRVNPAILPPLKQALALTYWYKKDLRSFLQSVLSDVSLVAQLDWSRYKRTVVDQLVDNLAASPSKYQDRLIDLILATAELGDPVHLKLVEDGEQKYRNACAALEVFRDQVEPYRLMRTDAEEGERRRREEEAKQQDQRALRERLNEIQVVFRGLLVEQNHQKRGYALEKVVNDLFACFDIDAKASFRVVGEQIDGAFSFEGTDYLFEAKWQAELSEPAALDVFSGKVGRKLENTLGLFLSINGFQQSAVDLYSQNRSKLILMDGSDLNAILDGAIELPLLLTRKRQHASSTGEVYVTAYQLLGGD
jgi:hypothetical protein